MENKQKIKIVFTIASLAVISIFFTVRYGKRRWQKLRSSSCYLQTEVKPQHSFKRSLADNSYAPFRHLKRIESDDSMLPQYISISLLESLSVFAAPMRCYMLVERRNVKIDRTPLLFLNKFKQHYNLQVYF